MIAPGDEAQAPVLKLAPAGADAERAKRIREHMIEAVKPVIAVLDDARANGFEVNFSLGQTPVGTGLVMLKVSKEF